MSFPSGYRTKLLGALQTIDAAKVDQAIRVFARAREEDRQIFVFGNGGSAATANHFACDIVKGASYGRNQRFRIMALSEQIPTMTAYANDVGYDAVFVEQLKNFARPRDVAVAISGSGNSANVIRAIEYARSAGCYTIGLSGMTGGKLRPLVDLSLHVDDHHMGRVEDAHMVIMHMICYYFMDREAPAEA
ncbi:MAG: SIS domain-containing protein [Bryobacterales bacterium]|nr:SIS domain-containing protein [Bryobacterales bacterium]MDE0294121.1 SIS domain-containing protein [Bryobacterales bacterium]